MKLHASKKIFGIYSEKDSKKHKILRLGGIITDVKVLYDKRNNQWAITTLDCLSGTAEIFAFSNIYQKYSNLLIEDTKIFIQGKPSDRGDDDPLKPKIIVDNIWLLKDIRNNLTRTINIKIPYSCQDPNMLESIKDIAKAFSGNYPLVLYLEDSNQNLDKVRFSEIRVSSSKECLEALRSSLPEVTVRIGI